MKEKHFEEIEIPVSHITNKKVALQYVAENINAYRNGEDNPRFNYLSKILLSDKSTAKIMNLILEGGFYNNNRNDLMKEYAKKLYGIPGNIGITRLENYAKCAYSQFLSYGLKLKEREKFSIEAYDIGNLYHITIQKFFEMVNSKQLQWKEITDEKSSELIKKAVKYTFEKYDNEIRIINVDKLTYAGNLENLKEIEDRENYTFVKADICDADAINKIFEENDIDRVVHFAAESHVDRSIKNPDVFVKTNVLGTLVMLNAAKAAWELEDGTFKADKKFLHVSTDEVYGSLSKDYTEAKELVLNDRVKKVAEGRKNLKTYGDKFFTEETPLDPRSPYSASKTSSDMIVRAYAETYKFPMNITRCSNNYGPYQFPEKLIPLIIKNILEGKKLPVYGDGSNVRDWLYVKDHNKAVDMVINNGRLGEVYNIGGFNEEKNINIVKLTIDTIAKIMKEEPEYRRVLKTDVTKISYDLISYVQDRLGHDARYAIDPEKIVTELGWYPETSFDKGIEQTIRWYLNNQEWVEKVLNK